LRASLKTLTQERTKEMGRKKVDRSDKVMQTFEATRPLKIRLEDLAKKRGITVSALIREILERHFEDRTEI
jgi:predicted DNA-binding ribbon-helix-helix protein